VVQAVRQGHWLAGGVVAAVALSAVICPLVDAWVCRRAEFAADRFAADRGLAIELPDGLRECPRISETIFASDQVSGKPGHAPLAKRNDEAHARRLVAQLERLGHTVVLDPVARPADRAGTGGGLRPPALTRACNSLIHGSVPLDLEGLVGRRGVRTARRRGSTEPVSGPWDGPVMHVYALHGRVP
jgi:hypothetical protein